MDVLNPIKGCNLEGKSRFESDLRISLTGKQGIWILKSLICRCRDIAGERGLYPLSLWWEKSPYMSRNWQPCQHFSVSGPWWGKLQSLLERSSLIVLRWHCWVSLTPGRTRIKCRIDEIMKNLRGFFFSPAKFSIF